jgi:hypothetical protein
VSDEDEKVVMESSTAYESDEERILNVGKPERKRKLRRSRHRWKDNILKDLKEIFCGLDSSASG